jgi:hypothetical protein
LIIGLVEHQDAILDVEIVGGRSAGRIEKLEIILEQGVVWIAIGNRRAGSQEQAEDYSGASDDYDE